MIASCSIFKGLQLYYLCFTKFYSIQLEAVFILNKIHILDMFNRNDDLLSATGGRLIITHQVYC